MANEIPHQSEARPEVPEAILLNQRRIQSSRPSRRKAKVGKENSFKSERINSTVEKANASILKMNRVLSFNGYAAVLFSFYVA